MTTDIRDCPPGTAPEWCLRFAYDGEEWLALADDSLQVRAMEHPQCVYGTESGGRYGVYQVAGFMPCSCGKATLFRGSIYQVRPFYLGDSLAEAEAAFTRIEAEWRAAKAGVL